MQETLRQSAEQFRLLVEGVKDYAIFMLDPQGVIITWNAGAERIKGYRADEILGEHFSRFYMRDAVARGWPQYELRVATAEGRFEDEGWRLRKDGSRFWANVVITALYDERGELRGFAKVTRDLTDRRRTEELERSERRMQEFLAMLAHELRNPLAPIRTAVQTMRMPGVNAVTLGRAREVIERQVQHLSRLVDDLLDVSRLTRGKITLQKEDLEVTRLVAGAVEASRPLIEARGHELAVDLPAEPLWVHGDPTRLSQVLLNLLDNAAKYTPPGGRIGLSVRGEQGAAVIRVRDTGIGITADLLPRIFDPFTQGDRSLDRAEGGLGIGLTLVHRLLEMHDGSVDALSAGPGLGSEFIIRLPLTPPPARTHAGEEGEARPQPAGSRRVLVVDDNRDALETLILLLELWGYEVHGAPDGETALALAREHRPAAVLLDIGLPRMSGYEVAQRLREIPGLADVLLIAVTGYGQEDERRRSRQAGFDVHLVKPVDAEELHRLIESTPEPAPAE